MISNAQMISPSVRHQMRAVRRDAYPIEKMQLIQFNGTRYEPVGGVFGSAK